MTLKYLIFGMLASCLNAQKKQVIKNDEFKYDTSYNQDKSKYFVDKRSSINGELLASYIYTSQNILMEGTEDHNWGWFSIECNDSTKEIREHYYLDTNKSIRDAELGREYILNNRGDTICDKSCFYTISGLSQKLDSTKEVKLQLYIPCSGFLTEDDVGFSSQLTITNEINIFRISEFNTKSKYIEINVGKLKRGKYKIYGHINVFHMIKNTSISDMSRAMYLMEEINIY